jgi:putative hydrolase of HD superfamily
MAMLAFMITDPKVNKDKLIKVCLVHDLAESVVGDITPHCGVSKEEKRRLEEVCNAFLCSPQITCWFFF